MNLVNALGGALASAALATLVALPAQNAPTAKAAKPAAGAPAKQDAKQDAKAKDRVGPDGKPVEVDPEAVVAARYTKAMTPNEQHQWLAGLTGKWKTTSKHMIQPGAPVSESAGTSEFKMLMDGRFLVESHDAGGSAGPFKGMGVTGFNTVTGKFERVWFDTTSTAMMKSEGEFDAANDAVRWTDSWTDPTTGVVRQLTSVLKKVDARQFTFQQIDSHRGAEFKTLQVFYKKDG